MAIRKRVLFLIPHLGGGGAERVIAHLASGLSPLRYEVHLGLITQCAASTELSSSITVHALGASRVRAAAIPLTRLIWRLRPHLIFSGIFHLSFLVLLLRPLLPRQIRYVVRQNGLIARKAGTSTLTRMLYRGLYPHADAIVCQSEAMAGELTTLLGSAMKLHVLPNPVMHEPQTSDSLWQSAGPNLLAIGRLVPSKGFDLLLTAFANLLQQFPTANLTVLGRGPEETSLKTLAIRLEIHTRVHFAGYVEQPQRWSSGASVFVLASRHEAMSNAMLEAAAAGLPIVAVPAMGGTTALLSGKSGVWMAENISAEALAQKLHEALTMLRPEERVQHEWLTPFRMENAVARYEQLFDALLAGDAR